MWAWILLAIFFAWAVRRLFFGYSEPDRNMRVLAPREVAFLDAAAGAMFPAGSEIPLSGREANLPGYVDGWLVLLPGRQRLLIRALILLVEQATLFFPAPGPSFRRFSSLDPGSREACLRAWSSSRLGVRRLVFTALRAVLTMGYLGHPEVLRHVGLGPYAIATPVLPADLMYPRAGCHPSTNPLTPADLTPPSDGTPLALDGPLHPDYAGEGS